MADLPTGAVTFLFTDIEGSTRLLKQLRERYGEVLSQHQRLLRDAFAAHRGHEIDTQGDSFFVAFASARDAVLAAIEGQLALLSHPWPEGVEVKVRMGVHTGQVAVSDGRYTGLAVHRAARIAAAGHGGQVLVSHATQTLLEDEEEDLHVFLRDLGEQRLKDLDRPVRLYQVGADGLPDSFPPLRLGAELAQAAEAAIAGPAWRQRSVLIAAALLLALLAAAAVFLATRDSAGGLSRVRPNHVGVIDPKTNEIVAEIPVGIRPGPVAAGAGSVWVGNLQDRTLTRIDARRRIAVGTVTLGNRTPTGIGVGAGAVWVAHGFSGELSRVDPQFNQVTQTVEVTTTTGRLHVGSAAVGEGSVWAVFGDSTLAHIDPSGVRVVGSTFAGAAPAGIVTGSRAVWVTNSEDATVFRFNPTSFEEGPVARISVGRQPMGIAVDAQSVWVANRGDDTVTRIDTDTASTNTIPVDDGPTVVAVGAGAVWIANTGATTISRIDPSTNDVTQTIELGNAPSGIAFAGGLVWIAVQAP